MYPLYVTESDNLQLSAHIYQCFIQFNQTPTSGVKNSVNKEEFKKLEAGSKSESC